MFTVILCSNSIIKEKALDKWLKIKFKNELYEIKKIKINNYKIVPEQPIDMGGISCCYNRILDIVNNDEYDLSDVKYIVSIENSIDILEDRLIDKVNIAIKDIKNNKMYYDSGGYAEISINILDKYPNFIKILKEFIDNYKRSNSNFIFNGSDTTLGVLINKYYKNISSDNWMKDILSIDRIDQIYKTFNKLEIN